MKQKLRKRGDDLILTVPRELAEKLKLKPGDEMDVEIRENCMCLWYIGVLDEVLESMEKGKGSSLDPGMVELMREQDVDLYK